MGKEQFIGSLKLLSSECRTSDGEVIYSMGKEVTGRLMYSPDGYMSVQHMVGTASRLLPVTGSGARPPKLRPLLRATGRTTGHGRWMKRRVQ